MPEPQPDDAAQRGAQRDAVERGDAYFLPDQHIEIGRAELAERKSADHQCQHLGAGVAAHSGDDRHQHRQCDDLLDRGREASDHGRSEEGRRQVDAEPEQPPPRCTRHRREQVLVLVQTGRAEGLVLGLLADDVDYVVDRDAAKQDVVLVHHRCGNPVVVRELACHLFGGGLDVDCGEIAVDQRIDRRVRVAGDQTLQRDPADQLVAAIDHVQVVGVVGQFGAQAQVAQHHVDRGVGAHRHHVRIHQAAGAVFFVGQHLFQALAVLAIHRLQYFVDDGVRQILDQVGKVVDVEVFDRGNQLVLVHVGDQAFADLVADVHQHLAVVFRIDQPPDHGAFARWQRFEQVADLGR